MKKINGIKSKTENYKKINDNLKYTLELNDLLYEEIKELPNGVELIKSNFIMNNEQNLISKNSDLYATQLSAKSDPGFHFSSLFFLNRNYLSTLFKLKTYLFRTPLGENDILSFKLNVILLITKCEILNFFSVLIASITINTYMN